jgi:hypothetical protein
VYLPPGGQIKLVIDSTVVGCEHNLDTITIGYTSFSDSVGDPTNTAPTVDFWQGSPFLPIQMQVPPHGGLQYINGVSCTPPFINTLTIPSEPIGIFQFTIYTFSGSTDLFVYALPAATFQGAWQPTFNYPRGAIVTHNSNTYVRLPATSSVPPIGNGNEPGTDPTQWQLISGIGPQGPQGPQGPAGPAGPITPGSVVMLPATGGTAPPPPAGYSFKGFILLTAKANGGGVQTSYAVYTKN